MAELDPMSLDLLINNAGSGTVDPFLQRPLEQQVRSVDLNITALMTLTHRLGTSMEARGHGGIINVCSTAAFQPMPYQASYAATKAFVLSFTEAIAHELRDSGVSVMAAHPGATDTSFFEGTSATLNPKTTDSAGTVPSGMLDDFAAGRVSSYPGRPSNRATTWAGRFLPRRTVATITGNLNRRAGFDQTDQMTG